MFMKRNLYQEVGGFDEDCFMYSDDIDLSYRILKEGKSNYYFHETTVIHYKGESTIKDGIYMKRFQEAMQFFYKKHYKASLLFSLFMKSGIIFFSFVKMFQGQPKIKTEPKFFALYSSNNELTNKLALIFQKKVAFHDLKTEKKVISYSVIGEAGTEIMLDNEFISFKECIRFMELSKNKGFTFRILPKNANFLIGSDNSRERGVVVKIE